MKQPFERAVTAHGAVVWRVCRALLPQHDAEDAWSEAFLAALQAWPALPDDAHVRGWLVTIAHRKALDVLRRPAPRPVAEPPDRVSALGVPDARDLDLQRAVESLPERERVAVVQHHLAGMPFADVAVATGTTPAAARKAASDGVKRLRTLMSETVEEHR